MPHILGRCSEAAGSRRLCLRNTQCPDCLPEVSVIIRSPEEEDVVTSVNRSPSLAKYRFNSPPPHTPLAYTLQYVQRCFRSLEWKPPTWKHIIIGQKQRQPGDGSENLSEVCIIKTWFMTPRCLGFTKPACYHYKSRQSWKTCRWFGKLMTEETISLNLLSPAGHSNTVNGKLPCVMQGSEKG